MQHLCACRAPSRVRIRFVFMSRAVEMFGGVFPAVASSTVPAGGSIRCAALAPPGTGLICCFACLRLLQTASGSGSDRPCDGECVSHACVLLCKPHAHLQRKTRRRALLLKCMVLSLAPSPSLVSTWNLLHERAHRWLCTCAPLHAWPCATAVAAPVCALCRLPGSEWNRLSLPKSSDLEIAWTAGGCEAYNRLFSRFKCNDGAGDHTTCRRNLAALAGKVGIDADARCYRRVLNDGSGSSVKA